MEISGPSGIKVRFERARVENGRSVQEHMRGAVRGAGKAHLLRPRGSTDNRQVCEEGPGYTRVRMARGERGPGRAAGRGEQYRDAASHASSRGAASHRTNSGWLGGSPHRPPPGPPNRFWLIGCTASVIQQLAKPGPASSPCRQPGAGSRDHPISVQAHSRCCPAASHWRPKRGAAAAGRCGGPGPPHLQA